MASSSWTNHLTIVNNTQIRWTHCIKVLIIFVWYENDLSIPLVGSEEFPNVFLALTSLMKTDHSNKIIERSSFCAKRSWSWILKQELFDTSACILSWKLSFRLFITWREENYCLVIIDLMFLAPFWPNIIDTLLEFACKISIAGFYTVSIFAN